jgi:NADPH-dependent 2,4-dienoyl-CoA reductase/sulfur reductase-like enzyme
MLPTAAARRRHRATLSAVADQHLVVVGASLAGLRAVDGARRAGFTGPVTLIGAEPHLPYDRPPLSKAFLAPGPEPAAPTLRTEQVLREELGVRLVLGAPATALDIDGRAVLVGQRAYPYTSAVLATGSLARRLPGTGAMAGVYSLRTLDDARRIRAAMDAGARVVVVGAGFIGSEVASAARARGLAVTVVEQLPTPLAHALGEPVGQAVAALHRRGGAELRCGVGVSALLCDSGPGDGGPGDGGAGDNGAGGGQVRAVALADGAELLADLVVVGAGALPSTAWLDGSGLALDAGAGAAGGVLCDETLHTGAPGVYAAGDVASWRHPVFGRPLRVEHWTNAAEQGMAAGRNAVEPAGATPFSAVPYFWSDLYGSRVQLVGLPTAEVQVVDGAIDGDYLVALYRDGDRLSGAVTLNGPAEVLRYRPLIQRGASWADGLELAAARRAARQSATATAPA